MDTVDQQSALLQSAQERIKGSQSLDGDSVRLAQYYREWADSYELDVDRQHYCGPSIVAELAGAIHAAYVGIERTSTAILDAGCGTGLVGIQLQHLGFRFIDGFDLSEVMAEMARQTGVYRDVKDDVDLNEPLSAYSSSSYDITVCCGVFTAGHVRPEGLRELVRVTRPTGFVIASICQNYFRTTSFEDDMLALQEAGIVRPILCLKEGRFIEQENANYWVLQVPEIPVKRWV